MQRPSCAVLFVILFLAYAECAVAQGTYTAATCNRSDVNAVINGPTHTAVNGDTINIPAGTCTWTSGITIPAGIGISILGSGTGTSNPGTFGPSASCSATVINDNSNSSLFRFQPGTSSSLSRVSCFKVTSTNPTGMSAPFAFAGTCNGSGCPNIRLDNVTIDSSTYGQTADSSSKVLTDNVFGVIDHNAMAGPSATGAGMEFLSYNHSSWKGNCCYGDYSWFDSDTFGTNQAVYVENNSFGNLVVVTETEAQVPNGAQGGGRVVVRFNNCNGCIVVLSNHGTDSNGRPRGARQGEVYGNAEYCTHQNNCQIAGVRSGVYRIFGNTATADAYSWYNQYFDQFLARTEGVTSTPWNNCPGAYDQTGPPIICLDQPSRSGGTLLSSVTPSAGWRNQTLDPNYEWDDSGKSTNFSTVTANSSPGGIIVANHDWYTDNSNGSPQAQTSSTSPFNGTSGVGFGTLARRPTTCTAAVGYFATDQGSWNSSGNSFGQGQFYICTATNTWTLSYTPYTYPHPLLTGTDTVAPTGLHAVVQ